MSNKPSRDSWGVGRSVGPLLLRSKWRCHALRSFGKTLFIWSLLNNYHRRFLQHFINLTIHKGQTAYKIVLQKLTIWYRTIVASSFVAPQQGQTRCKISCTYMLANYLTLTRASISVELLSLYRNSLIIWCLWVVFVSDECWGLSSWHIFRGFAKIDRARETSFPEFFDMPNQLTRVHSRNPLNWIRRVGILGSCGKKHANEGNIQS